MADKLLIHIGTPKAGSSAIQNFLEVNKQSLFAHNAIYLPRYKMKLGKVLHRASFGEEETCKRVKTIFDGFQRYQGYSLIASDEFICGFSMTDFETSAEDFAKATAKRLAAATEGYEVHLIVYLRRQDAYAESAFVQQFHPTLDPDKLCDFSEFAGFFNENALNWYKLVEVFADYFGLERLTVRPFVKDYLKESDVVTDFCSWADLEKLLREGILSNDDKNGLKENRGLKPAALKIMRHFYPKLQGQGQRRKLWNTMKFFYPRGVYEPAGFFTPESRLNFMEKYRESNDALFKDMLSFQENPLELDTAEAYKQGYADLEEPLTSMELTELMLKLKEVIPPDA